MELSVKRGGWLAFVLILTGCSKTLDRDRIAQSIQRDVIQQGGVSLKMVSCPKNIPQEGASYYINGKQVTLHPQGGLAVGRLVLPLLPEGTQAVAGLTLGADPIVTAVSVVAAYEGQSLPALIIRKEAKGHGTRAYIEGPALPDGSTVTVLEDVVTTGQSALRAVERLQQAGYQVNGVIALVDRQQGGAELYQQAGFPFQAVFAITEIQQRSTAMQRQEAGEGLKL